VSVVYRFFENPTVNSRWYFRPCAGSTMGFLILERFEDIAERDREISLGTCRTTLIFGDQAQSIKQSNDHQKSWEEPIL
jgi:hypothetical protein